MRHENIVGFKDVILDPFERSISIIFDYAEHDLLVRPQPPRAPRWCSRAPDGGAPGGRLCAALLPQQILEYHRDQRTELPRDMIKSIMWQLLNGIAYMHANWVLHRDLKPANILLMGEGPECGVVKIGARCERTISFVRVHANLLRARRPARLPSSS